jgi:sentrin-specific protease 1
VGGNYLKGYLLGEEEEGTRPLDNRGDKESMGSTAAATTMHDEGGESEIDVVHPDLIAIVDKLFHAVVDVDNMTTKNFYRQVGDCVGQGKMDKKVKRAIKERLTYLMEAERRKRSKAATITREEDKKVQRRSKRDSKPTEKMAEYHKERGLESGEDAVEYRRSKQEPVMGKEKKGSRAAATTRHDPGGEEVGGIDTEGDVAKEVRGNISGAPTTSLPYDFYVGQLVNVIEGKASHQATIDKVENEKATVRWMTWKGVAVVQVNQLRPIWDGSKRKRKEIDLFGSTQLKPAATATRLLKPKLPMRHYRKLPIPEKEPEKKLEEAEEPLKRKTNPPPIVHGSTRFRRNQRPLLIQRGLFDHLQNFRGAQTSAYFARNNCIEKDNCIEIENAIGSIIVKNSETSSDSDAQGLSTAETISAGKAGGRSTISALYITALDALSSPLQEYRIPRKMKIAPLFQIKYTGLDILAMGVMIAEWRPDVMELFDFAGKINKGREAVKKLVRHYIAKKRLQRSIEEAMKLWRLKKLVRHYIAKKHLQRSREEAMKLLRPLNPQEQSVVVEAMKKGRDHSEILVSSNSDSKDSVQRGSMQRLSPGKWLNDEVINYFLKNCLAMRDKKLCKKEPGRRRSHFFNSFFVQNLFDLKNKDQKLRGIYNYEKVRRWSRMVPTPRDIFSLKYIFCPININNSHWTLAVIFMEAKKIQYYDSCGKTDMAKMQGLLEYVKDEYRAKHDGKEMDAKEWELVSCMSDTPRQKNGEFHLQDCACKKLSQYFTFLPSL